MFSAILVKPAIAPIPEAHLHPLRHAEALTHEPSKPCSRAVLAGALIAFASVGAFAAETTQGLEQALNAAMQSKRGITVRERTGDRRRRRVRRARLLGGVAQSGIRTNPVAPGTDRRHCAALNESLSRMPGASAGHFRTSSSNDALNSRNHPAATHPAKLWRGV
jgi:hypothetical protein